MPALGNHECEFGVDTFSGQPGAAPGGIAAQGAAGNHWNGPYGFGHYLNRFLLPDSGLVNWDGNRLRGNFYTFQVGTIQYEVDLAAINPTDAYGYAIFDVDPGERPGDTTITFLYFAIPAVTNEATSAHNGTTTLPTTETEKFVFGRRVGGAGF